MWIWILSSRVQLEDKIHIHAQSCNILYVISRMSSASIFIVSLALIRVCVWFCFNFFSLLACLTFLFICRGGWGGKPQCFICYLLTDLKKFSQLSCFITINKWLLRGKLIFKSSILTRTTTISIVHFYCYSIVSFFCKFNITRFYICYCLLLLLLSLFHIVCYFQMDCFEALFSFAS